MCIWCLQVHQLLTQFAASFDFNVRLLEMLAEQAYCPEYAEFAYQSPRERASLESDSASASGGRCSLCQHLLSAREAAAPYRNPLYEHCASVLVPALSPTALVRCSRNLYSNRTSTYTFQVISRKLRGVKYLQLSCGILLKIFTI